MARWPLLHTNRKDLSSRSVIRGGKYANTQWHAILNFLYLMIFKLYSYMLYSKILVVLSYFKNIISVNSGDEWPASPSVSDCVWVSPDSLLGRWLWCGQQHWASQWGVMGKNPGLWAWESHKVLLSLGIFICKLTRILSLHHNHALGLLRCTCPSPGASDWEGSTGLDQYLQF